MGRSKDGKSFWPDDTPTEFYLEGYYGRDLAEILGAAQKRWPGIKIKEIEIEPEYIHTECIGYPHYDPGDYTSFLKITALEEYFDRTKSSGEQRLASLVS